MNALSSFDRNNVIRLIALVSVVAFPLIADAELGPRPQTVKPADASPVTAFATKAVVAKAVVADPNSCADQHWPFFSRSCLRGSGTALEPRLVSMNAEALPKPAASENSVKLVAATNAPKIMPSARSKPSVKPRVAAHVRTRRDSNYGVNPDMGRVSLAGW